MIIYRALKSNTLSQKFGTNVFFDYSIFGLKGHNGIDWVCYLGEPIYWDCDCLGYVVSTCNDTTAGVGCEIITEDKDGIFKHIFWHFKMGGLKVQVGQILESGDLIGYGDSTGYSTGNHLHRGLKKQYKDELDRYQTLDTNNGFNGAIDPASYFKNIFIKDCISILEQQISLAKKIIEAINNFLKGR
jgi:hypothetical protein